MYNLVSIISEGPDSKDAVRRVKLLNSDISERFEPGFFMTKRTHLHSDNGEGEHVYDSHVVDAFSQAGYTLESNDEDENGLVPLNNVKQPSTLSVDLN
jgi:hypothetical protein